jgi:tRNA A-37 threonylcarbamoyl transferase component Bud32
MSDFHERLGEAVGAYAVRQREGIDLLIRRDWEEEDLLKILCARAETLRGNPSCAMVPTCKGSLVFRVKGSRGELYLKHFRTVGWPDRIKALMRGGRAQRSWRGGRLLQSLGFNTPLLVASGGSSSFFAPPVDFLLTEAVRGPRLRHLLREGFENTLAEKGWRKRPFLRTLALTIAELHRRGIYHGDLNPTNILVILEGDLNPSTFCFLDNTRCRFMKEVPYQLRVKDLAGLNNPRLGSVSVRDRLRFFSLYRRHLGSQDGMEMIQDIQRRSMRPRKRHHAGA